MVNAQMPIVMVDGTKAHIRMFLKDINHRASKVVHDGNVVYVALPAQELSWLDGIAKDTGVRRREVPKFPAHGKAPCGLLTTKLRYHMSRCRKCTVLRAPEPQHGESKTVVKVEGLHDLTLSGLVELMRRKMDESLALAQEYDTVLKALEKMPALQEQLTELQRQIAEHQQALGYFMKHG